MNRERKTVSTNFIDLIKRDTGTDDNDGIRNVMMGRSQ